MLVSTGTADELDVPVSTGTAEELDVYELDVLVSTGTSEEMDVLVSVETSEEEAEVSVLNGTGITVKVETVSELDSLEDEEPPTGSAVALELEDEEPPTGSAVALELA